MSTKLTILLILLVNLLGCEDSIVTNTGTLLAKVGSSNLYVEDINKRLPNGLKEPLDVAAKKSLRDDWIKNELLYQEAKRLGLLSNSDVKKRIEAVTREVIAQTLRDQFLASIDSLIISDFEAQQFYEANKDQFILKEDHIRFRHVQTSNLDDSRSAKTALLRGITFEKVVEQYALDKVQTISNSDQFFPLSLAVSTLPTLNRYLQVMGIMEISPIRLLEGRYHFVQIIERRPAGEHPDLTWVMNKIKEWLLIEKKRKLLNAYERELYLKAEANNEIKIYQNSN